MQAQKAKEKEEDHELKEKVDIDFAALVQSNGLSCLVRPKKNVLKSLLERDSISKIDTNFGAPKADDTTREAKVKHRAGLLFSVITGCCSPFDWLLDGRGSSCLL